MAAGTFPASRVSEESDLRASASRRFSSSSESFFSKLSASPLPFISIRVQWIDGKGLFTSGSSLFCHRHRRKPDHLPYTSCICCLPSTLSSLPDIGHRRAMCASASSWVGANPGMGAVGGACLSNLAARLRVSAFAWNRGVCGRRASFRLKTFNVGDRYDLLRR